MKINMTRYSHNAVGIWTILVCYILVLIGVVTILQVLIGKETLSPSILVHFDASHYQGIMLYGYGQESSAFFPLFPYSWRALGVGPLGISLFNTALFLFALSTLISVLSIHWRTVLIWLTLPTVFFLMLPYTEAWFFIGASGVIVGVRRKQLAFTLLGLFACTVARPAFTALLPALIFATALGHESLKRKLFEITTVVSTCLVGLATVVAIQYHDTGDIFAFYTAQSGYGNSLKFPSFPLTSWGGGSIVRLDATALLIGILSGGVLLWSMIRRWKNKPDQIGQEVVLSVTYLFVVSGIALMLRGGELYSLNRFIFATPFSLVLIHEYFEHRVRLPVKNVVVIFFGLLIYFLFFGSFVHIQTFGKFAVLSAFLSIYLIYPNMLLNRRSWVFPWILLASFIIQVYYLLHYLGDEWVA